MVIALTEDYTIIFRYDRTHQIVFIYIMLYNIILTIIYSITTRLLRFYLTILTVYNQIVVKKKSIAPHVGYNIVA